MQHVVCNLCGIDAPHPLVNVRDCLYWTPGLFRIVQCGRCGLVYQDPQPSGRVLQQAYPASYIPHLQDSPSIAQRLNHWYALSKRRRLVEHFAVTPGRVLDVGCATGRFLAEMSKHGWDSYGVEPDPQAGAYARNHRGLAIWQGTLHTANYPSAWFDAVTLWDVLEHIPDPLAELREIRRILRSGGIIVVKVPNGASPDRRLFGSAWSGYDPPRHLYIFTPTTLVALLHRAGFELAVQTRMGGNHPMLAFSTQMWAGERWGSATGQFVGRALQRMPIRLILTLYALALERVGQGSTLTMVARSD